MRFDADAYKKQLQRKLMKEMRDEENQRELAKKKSSRTPAIPASSKYKPNLLVKRDQRGDQEVPQHYTPQHLKAKSMIRDGGNRVGS